MKKAMPYILICIVMTIILTGISVGIIKTLAMPLDVPFVNKSDIKADFTEQNSLMEQWSDIRLYTLKDRHDTIEELLDATEEVESQNEGDFYSIFPEIDKDSLDKYLTDNKIAKEYEKLFIDKVTKDNKPTGIKTVDNKDVLAIDVFNKILILGDKTNTGDKVKIAVVKNNKQIDFSVVENLSYWDNIQKHAKDNRAILAVNANSYTWNESGQYGTNYGLIKWHGTVIRKPKDNSHIAGFTKEGQLKIGKTADIESLYNATEYNLPLIDSSVARENVDNKIKLARTAVGQQEDGTVIIVNGAGADKAEANKGITEKELQDLMVEFKVVNSSELSSGNKSIMYWNDRIVNSTFGYSDEGVRLPTAILVKPSNLD